MLDVALGKTCGDDLKIQNHAHAARRLPVSHTLWCSLGSVKTTNQSTLAFPSLRWAWVFLASFR